MTERKLPAYPLLVKEPNFSLWLATDDPTEGQVKSWWGEEKPVYGFVRTEEGVYCFLGDYNEVKAFGVKRAKVQSVGVTSFTTDYDFTVGKGRLKLSFVSPLLPSDADMISLPVCYLNYEVTGVKTAEVSLFLSRKLCFNDTPANTNRQVHGGVAKCGAYEAAFFGLKRQLYLSNNDDGAGADWGYFYAIGPEAYLTDESAVHSYLATGVRAFGPRDEALYIAAFGGGKGRLAIAYNDIVAIDYFGSFKKGLYLEKHTIYEAIDAVMQGGDAIDEKLTAFDADLHARAAKVSEDYYEILAASLRQSIAAHKLVRDDEGQLLFLSKENYSNGCIATVDVSYPSMPLYLLYNTELVKGMIRPIFKFAELPVWPYDFAPHDVGTYPACCGQVYGLKGDCERYHGNYRKDGFLQTHIPLYELPESFDAYDLTFQMPVEECANLLVMVAACYRFDGDLSLFKAHKPLLEKWAEYLVKYGLKPENQLCTDDFAGHLSNNLNLAMKATVGLGAYGRLCKAAGEKAEKYTKVAQSFASEITAFISRFTHSPLTWDSGEETYALKYNLAFDKLLGLNLFSVSLYEKETDGYLRRLNKFGVPLDSRKPYTKSDWICWVASLTSDKEKQRALLAPIARFLRESPARVPFTDWYDTHEGTQCGFQARSVQGGCFILLLSEKEGKV